MIDQKKFSIIIPNWNGENLIRKNLDKVINTSNDSEIIVVDDASSDKSVELIKKRYPEVRLLTNEKNLGFGESCNRGVMAAVGEIVVLLNTDVYTDKGYLAPLIEDFKDEKIFAISLGEASSGPGWANFKDGEVQLVRKERQEERCFAFWASGGQSAFRRSVWLQLGGFDSLYKPFYWEDIDLSYRAWKRGYAVVWEPRAVVHHMVSSTIKKNFSEGYINSTSERNKLIFIWKNIDSIRMRLEHKLWLTKRLVSSPGYGKPFLAALAKTPVIIPRFLKELRDKKVSDEAIFAQFK